MSTQEQLQQEITSLQGKYDRSTSREAYRIGETIAADKRTAMRVDWMVGKELDEAIPPVYTEFIGKQLLTYLNLQK